MTPAPLALYPTPTQVGEPPEVQATGERLEMPEKVVEDQVDPVPPQAAEAPAVPLPVDTQVSAGGAGTGHAAVDGRGARRRWTR